MNRQRAGIRSLAGINRVLVSALGLWICLRLSWLHIGGAPAIIVFGFFFAEALTVAAAPNNRPETPSRDLPEAY